MRLDFNPEVPQEVTINGVRFSQDFFALLGSPAMDGSVVRLIKKDGTIQMERICESHQSAPEHQAAVRG